MKLLLDEMYAGLKEYLETLGYNVQTVQAAGLSGAKDREVVDYAGKNGLRLSTEVQKPAELAQLLDAKLVDQKIKELP
jgi:predicted nuclease of predicted toxin-antitoxin system